MALTPLNVAKKVMGAITVFLILALMGGGSISQGENPVMDGLWMLFVIIGLCVCVRVNSWLGDLSNASPR